MCPDKEVHLGVEAAQVDLADEISENVRKLNGLLETARKQGLVVQVSMIAIENVPALRLDAVYKRLDKPLILRV